MNEHDSIHHFNVIAFASKCNHRAVDMHNSNMPLFPSIFNVAYQMLIFESFRIVAREKTLSTLISTHLDQYVFYKISYISTYTP